MRHVLPIVVLLAAASSACTRRAPEIPSWTYRGEFRDAIQPADRIVVRDGGFKGPVPMDQQQTLFQVTDPGEIRELAKHVQFQVDQKPKACPHWGYPGIDWYHGEQCLAMTAVQHCKMIRWDGFPSDALMTDESAAWLKQWLLRRGIAEEKLR